MDIPKPTVIKVLGLGGGGSNAVNRMIELGLEGVGFIAANTDAQALNLSLAPTRIQLGPRLTRGLGAGGNPEIGEAAADENRAELKAALAGADLVFLTAGMGGGTGTGAIPVAAEAARAVAALTIAIVTTPFTFEATRRRRNAEAGLAKLRPKADTLITVPNDKLLNLVGRNIAFDVSLRVADEVLRQGVQGLAELIGKPGLINVDFAHVRELLARNTTGRAMLAIGHGRGERKADEAVQQALKMPLLESGSVESARGLLVHFTGGDDLSLVEASQAVADITRAAPQAEVIFGATVDPLMTGRAQVILAATGLPEPPPHEAVIRPTPASIAETHRRPTPHAASDEQASPLAEALFNQAFTNPDPLEQPWVVADTPAPNANSLDVPAFLRKRRSLRDLEKGK
ncbi:MAG: cell division protein FtsZ [Anaerolineales bacterium]